MSLESAGLHGAEDLGDNPTIGRTILHGIGRSSTKIKSGVEKLGSKAKEFKKARELKKEERLEQETTRVGRHKGSKVGRIVKGGAKLGAGAALSGAGALTKGAVKGIFHGGKKATAAGLGGLSALLLGKKGGFASMLKWTALATMFTMLLAPLAQKGSKNLAKASSRQAKNAEANVSNDQKQSQGRTPALETGNVQKPLQLQGQTPALQNTGNAAQNRYVQVAANNMHQVAVNNQPQAQVQNAKTNQNDLQR